MQHISKALLFTPWRGSEQTAEAVREQIRTRWGDEVADDFDASKDAAPFTFWASQNYRIRKGERALKSITFVEVKDEHDKVVRKIPRTCNIFHKRQVEKIN